MASFLTKVALVVHTASAAFAPSLAQCPHQPSTRSAVALVAIAAPADNDGETMRASAALNALERLKENKRLLRETKEKIAQLTGQMSKKVETAAAMASATAVTAAASQLNAASAVMMEVAANAQPHDEAKKGDAIPAHMGPRGQTRVRSGPVVAQAAAVAERPAATAAAPAAAEPAARRPITDASRRSTSTVLPTHSKLRTRAPEPPPAKADEPTPPEFDTKLPTIKVFGIGGGGGNTVARIPAALTSMLHGMGEGAQASSHSTLEMCLLNTDVQALALSEHLAATATAEAAAEAVRHARPSAGKEVLSVASVQLGTKALAGLGAGGNPAKAREAAEAHADEIDAQLDGAELVFITAGLGGGTGSGAAPVVAKLARARGALVVAVVSTPFDFEGSTRADVAAAAEAELQAEVDVLVVCHNQRLMAIPGMSELPLPDCMLYADEVARQAIVGVASMLSSSQTINVDFADVRQVMEASAPTHRGLISVGRGSGEDAAVLAVEAALTSPLLDVKLEKVRGLAYSITGGAALSLHQVQRVGNALKPIIDDDAAVIFGASIDPSLPDDEVIVSMIATGFEPPPPPPPRARGHKPWEQRRAADAVDELHAPPSKPYDIFAYHAPTLLTANEDGLLSEDALAQYAEYLQKRAFGEGQSAADLAAAHLANGDGAPHADAKGVVHPRSSEEAAAVLREETAAAARRAHEAAHGGQWGI